MAQRAPQRRHVTWSQPVPARQPRKRSRRTGRFILLVTLLTIVLIGGRMYLLHVYAPRLQTEARAVPGLVHAQLEQEGAPYVPLRDISPNLRNAIVAIEDQRFYHHPGVDPLGIIRAFWIDLTQKHVDQGGSTLEEQLVKRAIIHEIDGIHVKLRTMALAWAVDQDFSKQEVLELYLNAAYYGQGAYGVGNAARVYFGTDPADLTLPQAALLAALPQAPSIYGANPQAPVVVARQQTVIRDMAQQGYISADEERAALDSKLTFALANP